MDREPEKECFAAYGYTATFFRELTKGKNFRDFLFTFLGIEALPTECLLLKERIFSCRSKFLPYKSLALLKYEAKTTLKEITSQTDQYLVILSSKTNVVEDKMTKY